MSTVAGGRGGVVCCRLRTNSFSWWLSAVNCVPVLLVACWITALRESSTAVRASAGMEDEAVAALPVNQRRRRSHSEGESDRTFCVLSVGAGFFGGSFDV